MNKFCPPNSSDNLYLFLLYLSFFCALGGINNHLTGLRANVIVVEDDQQLQKILSVKAQGWWWTPCLFKLNQLFFYSNLITTLFPFVRFSHRRRMETEAKAKVVASGWGAEFIQFLAVLAILSRHIGKNSMNSTFSSKLTEAKQLVWQEI